MANGFSNEHKQIIQHVQAEGHEYVLRWLNELGEDERAILLEQLAGLDFDRVRELAALTRRQRKEQSLEGVEPAPVSRLPGSESERRAEERVVERGAEALRRDRVAALTVAGGQSTRLHYKPPKGIFPITPVLKKSFFQVHAEKVLAARRRYRCRMPWLVMISPLNEAETRAFFRENGFFGLGEGSVRLFAQPLNPIVRSDGRLAMEEKCHLLTGPDGHGGVFEALARSSLLSALQDDGFDLISYFQVDNPLVTVADERFLGHHLQQESEFSCKVIPKRDAGEGLGVAALRSGRPCIVEYSDLPEEMAREQLASGELKYLFGSIAVHIINTSFARAMSEGGISLPWRVARKTYEVVSNEGAKAQEECCKFERFVFDCMAHASGCVFVEVERASEFAPVKRREGPDNPATSQAMMRALWLRWLREAGADLRELERDPEAALEIGPLFGSSGAELKEKLPAGWRPSPPVVLDEPGRARLPEAGPDGL